MADFGPYTKRHLDAALIEIADRVYSVLGELHIEGWCTREPVCFAERTTGQHRIFRAGDRWGDLFDCAWFHFTGTVPDEAAGRKVVALLDANGEMCVFDERGVPQQGLTNVSSSFDMSLGKPGKHVLPLVECARGGEPFDV